MVLCKGCALSVDVLAPGGWFEGPKLVNIVTPSKRRIGAKKENLAVASW